MWQSMPAAVVSPHQIPVPAAIVSSLGYPAIPNFELSSGPLVTSPDSVEDWAQLPGIEPLQPQQLRRPKDDQDSSAATESDVDWHSGRR